MPIVSAPINPGIVTLSGLTAVSVIPAGAAVAATSSGIELCAANTNAGSFAGFAVGSANIGDPVTFYAGRGQSVDVIVEGGMPLTLDAPVYLSNTPGEVSSAEPAYPATILRVGMALTASQIILLTDMRIKL